LRERKKPLRPSVAAASFVEGLFEFVFGIGEGRFRQPPEPNRDDERQDETKAKVIGLHFPAGGDPTAGKFV
jgi:hypothetical protein